MTAIYAESSAVLRWLLGQADALMIKNVLATADSVITSSLTTAEIGRTLHRLLATGHLSPQARNTAWGVYERAAAHWKFHLCSEDVLERVTGGFPAEPIRTLDAIHVATASLYSRQVVPLTMLSTDLQVRENAHLMGLTVIP